MKRCLLLLGLCCGWNAASAPLPPEYVAAATVGPVVHSVAQDTADLINNVADIVFLPMGAAEILLSPLPGMELPQGARNLSRGILAPFKALHAAVRLPATLLRGTKSAISGAPGYLLP